MTFIETPVFTSLVERLLRDEDYRALQLALTLRPEQGVVVPGGGGIRKLRWRVRGGGKRGGLRIIYYWLAAEDAMYMLFIYRKTRQSDLTRAQLSLLRKLVEEELG